MPKESDLITRPSLTKKTDPEVFKKFYWDKKELVSFCNLFGLPAQGSKLELVERIEHFLRTGNILQVEKIVRVGPWDSASTILSSTPVVNYKNDAATSEFFKRKLGQIFHFNNYLRQFAKAQQDGSLTYKDLVEGWREAENAKVSAKSKEPIARQFQYNQFQRDYFNDKSEKRDSLRKAWLLVRSVAGEASYEHYKQLLLKGISLDDIEKHSDDEDDYKKT